MPIELRLAAIISLLSSASINGLSETKLDAIRAHVDAAVRTSDTLDENLKQTLKTVLTEMTMLYSECVCQMSEAAQLTSLQTLH